jgi:hypothetical protein
MGTELLTGNIRSFTITQHACRHELLKAIRNDYFTPVVNTELRTANVRFWTGQKVYLSPEAASAVDAWCALHEGDIIARCLQHAVQL